MGKKLILFMVLCAAMTACNAGKTYRHLKDIESYISARPDSALAELRSIDTLDLHTRAAKAKYSLLHAMALDKNYIDTTDLGIITPAVSYYENHGSIDDRMKAYYYQGRIYENAGDMYSAMNALTTAYDISEKSDDNDFKCLICAELAGIYSHNGNSRRSLYYSQKAKDYADLAQNDLHSWIMQGRIASCYANSKQWETADSLYSLFLQQPIRDTSYYAAFAMSASHVAVRKKPSDAAKCLKLYKQAVSLGRRPTVANLGVVAFAYELMGEEEETDRIMSAVSAFIGDGKNSAVDLWKYRIEKHRGNYEASLSYFEFCIQSQDSALVAALEESFDKVQKDYYSEKANRLSAEKQTQEIKSGIIIFFIVLICAILFALYLRYKRRWIQIMEDAESLRNDFARLLNEGNDKDVALNELRKQYHSMFKEQFKTLDDLCAAFWSPKKGSKKNLIYHASSKAIELIKNDSRLEETIDKYLDGVMSKMRIDLPKHKDKDFKLIALFIIGFSGKTIASIMDISVNTVYTYKNRLKQEIGELNSQNKELYLDLIR